MSYPIEVRKGWSLGSERMGGAITALDRMTIAPGQRVASPYSHVFHVFTFPHGLELIAESLIGKGVRLSTLANLRRSTKVITSYLSQPLPINPHGIAAMWDRFLELEGKPYDLRHIGGLFLWIASGSRMRDHRPAWLDRAINDQYICSELTAELDAAGGYDCHCGFSTKATTTPHSQLRAYLSEMERLNPASPMPSDVVRTKT